MNATAWCLFVNRSTKNIKMVYGMQPFLNETDLKVSVLFYKYIFNIFIENQLLKQIIDSAPIVDRNSGNKIYAYSLLHI